MYVLFKGVIIRGCQSGWLEIPEDKITPIYCDGIHASDTVRWSSGRGGVAQVLGECGPVGQPCNSTSPDMTTSRVSNTSSELTIVHRHRAIAGNRTFYCVTPRAASRCHTNVIAPAQLSSCHVETDSTAWAAVGSCRYRRAFSSNGSYTCAWHRQTPGQMSDSGPGALSSTPHGTGYYSGTCHLNWLLPIPPMNGNYTYSVSVFPGPQRRAVGTVTIQLPERPVTNCPHYLYEGQALSCDCVVNPSVPGSPRPVVQWHGYSPGQQMVKYNVTRRQTGHSSLCQLKWGPPANQTISTTTYIWRVAYGPDEVTITAPEDPQIWGTQNTTILCTARGVYPAAIFVWSGVTCVSAASDPTADNSSACTFLPVPGDDGKVVTCEASNSLFPDRFQRTASYEMRRQSNSNDTRAYAGNGATDNSSNTAAYIGGGVAAAVVLAAAILVGALFYRRYLKNNVYDRTQPRRQESSIYTDLVVYDTVRQAPQTQQQQQRAVTAQYENVKISTTSSVPSYENVAPQPAVFGQ